VIERIDRADDPRAGDYAHVADPGWLRDRGLFVAEGRLVVQRLLAAGRFRIRSLFVTPAALAALVPGDDLHVLVAEQPVLNAITGFNFHRGCLALAERPPDAALESVASATRLLALEGVANPDNVGGLFRVAAAFGVDGILLDPASGDPLYRKAIRTSMAAALTVPFVRLADWPAGLRSLKRAGFTVVALTPHSEARPLAEFAGGCRAARLVVLVGAEGAGLSDAAMGVADARVKIPIAAHVDSLNVTVAAGIALSHLR